PIWRARASPFGLCAGFSVEQRAPCSSTSSRSAPRCGRWLADHDQILSLITAISWHASQFSGSGDRIRIMRAAQKSPALAGSFWRNVGGGGNAVIAKPAVLAISSMTSIVEGGAPLGKTKRVDSNGASNTKNEIGGYSVVQAESHDAATKIFGKDH